MNDDRKRWSDERRPGETWRDVVIRVSEPHGLDRECLELYDDVDNREDVGDERAAWEALYEWDCLP